MRSALLAQQILHSGQRRVGHLITCPLADVSLQGLHILAACVLVDIIVATKMLF